MTLYYFLQQKHKFICMLQHVLPIWIFITFELGTIYLLMFCNIIGLICQVGSFVHLLSYSKKKSKLIIFMVSLMVRITFEGLYFETASFLKNLINCCPMPTKVQAYFLSLGVQSSSSYLHYLLPAQMKNYRIFEQVLKQNSRKHFCYKTW